MPYAERKAPKALKASIKYKVLSENFKVRIEKIEYRE